MLLQRVFFLLILTFTILISCNSTKGKSSKGITNANNGDDISVKVGEENDKTLKKEMSDLLNLRKQAEASIAHAEEADSQKFAPQLLSKAYSFLKEEQKLGEDSESDITKREELLEESLKASSEAFKQTVKLASEKWLNDIKNMIAQFETLNGPMFMPKYYGKSKDLYQSLSQLLNDNKYNDAFTAYKNLSLALDEILRTLKHNLSWIDELKNNTELALNKVNAMEKEDVNTKNFSISQENYDKALDYLNNGNLYEAEKYLMKSNHFANLSIEGSTRNQLLKEIDNKILTLKDSLDKTKEQQIQNNDGSLSHINDDWSADDFLQNNPLKELSSSSDFEERHSRILTPRINGLFLENDDPVMLEKDNEEDSMQNDIANETVLSRLDYDFPNIDNSSEYLVKLQLSSFFSIESYIAQDVMSNIEDSDNESVEEEDEQEDVLNEAKDDVEESEYNYYQEETQFPEDKGNKMVHNEPLDPKIDNVINPIPVEQNNKGNSKNTPMTPNFSGKETILDNNQSNEKESVNNKSQIEDNNESVSFLNIARESWKNAIIARNERNFEKAKAYLEKAEQALDTYNTLYSVSQIYIVRSLVPADCLWRIAGRIYKDPFKWGRIYQRNRDKIKNPSLIYPGQKFIIPVLK